MKVRPFTTEVRVVYRVNLPASIQYTALWCQGAEALSDHVSGAAQCSLNFYVNMELTWSFFSDVAVVGLRQFLVGPQPNQATIYMSVQANAKSRCKTSSLFKENL